MLWEAIGAALLGVTLLWLVLEPLAGRSGHAAVDPGEPPELEETARGRALLALKDVEFDHATGKLSDPDYQALRERYTAEAVAALRADGLAPLPAVVPRDAEALVAVRRRRLEGREPGAGAGDQGTNGAGTACPLCGPRPEPDARYCSSCGRALFPETRCARCEAGVAPGARFCSACGAPVT